MDPAPGYRIDPGQAAPPYEQLRAEIARRAADGELPFGSRLPTVRALAERDPAALEALRRGVHLLPPT